MYDIFPYYPTCVCKPIDKGILSKTMTLFLHFKWVER